MEITIRQASRDELTRINELRRQVNDLHVSGRPDIFRPGFCSEMQEHIYDRFDCESCAVIAAFFGETLCGFATVIYMTKPASPYSLERRIYQIEEFGVDRDFRRRGVASKLVSFMKQDAKSKGFDRIELDMWTFNESAYEFYKAVGFTTYRRYMELNVSGYPTRENARRLLYEAELLNPGAWGDHSRVAAGCAEAIAKKCADLDPDKAYVLGLMHDIGRRFGLSYLRHVLDGYEYMLSLGYPDAAKVCLTHSFSVKDINDYVGESDVTACEKDYISSALQKCDYDDYDRLIQLCDAIAMPHGVVSLEERMNDVKSRYGRYPQKKWDQNLLLKTYFEQKAGEPIEVMTRGVSPNSEME